MITLCDIQKVLFTRCDCECDFYITTNGLYGIQCECSDGATATMTPYLVQHFSCDKRIAITTRE